MKELGVEAARLAETGLLRANERDGGYSGFFFNRVMFPIRDRGGGSSPSAAASWATGSRNT